MMPSKNDAQQEWCPTLLMRDAQYILPFDWCNLRRMSYSLEALLLEPPCPSSGQLSSCEDVVAWPLVDSSFDQQVLPLGPFWDLLGFPLGLFIILLGLLCLSLPHLCLSLPHLCLSWPHLCLSLASNKWPHRAHTENKHFQVKRIRGKMASQLLSGHPSVLDIRNGELSRNRCYILQMLVCFAHLCVSTNP